MRLRTLTRIGCTVLIGSAATLVPLSLGGAAAASAPDAASWHLVGHHQHACFDTNVHDAWFGVFIKGTWTHRIDVGLKHLPRGGTFTTSYTPIPPGSGDGQHTVAYADAKIANDTPVGTYFAVLWASDGTTRDRVSVELDVTSDCGY
jgi:hypothetical protein